MHNLVVIAIFSMAFILFWLFLRYIIAEASPAQNSGVIGSSFRVDRSSRGDPGNLLNGSGPAS